MGTPKHRVLGKSGMETNYYSEPLELSDVAKYIAPDSVLDWIKKFLKINIHPTTIIWKSVYKSLSVIKNGLAWKVGNGSQLGIGVDPWSRSQNHHILPQPLIQHLNQKGFYHFNKIADPGSTNI